YKSVPYDVVHDFTPVTLLAEGPLIVSTTPSVPANNLKDFFALVRKDPQKYTFGGTSLGSAGHLAIELLKHDAGLDTLVITYKGTAPALTDLMSGQIQLLADPMLSSLPLAQGGKIKALGLTSLKRAAAAPEMPTVEESGLKGFAFVSWYGLWGPKDLPADLSNKLQAEIAKVLALPDVKQRLNALGFEPIGSDGKEFATYIREEMAKDEKIINDARIKVECARSRHAGDGARRGCDASQRRCFTRKLGDQHRKYRHADRKVESYRVQIRRYCGARALFCCRIRRGQFVVECTRSKPPRANLRPRRLRQRLAREPQGAGPCNRGSERRA